MKRYFTIFSIPAFKFFYFRATTLTSFSKSEPSPECPFKIIAFPSQRIYFYFSNSISTPHPTHTETINGKRNYMHISKNKEQVKCYNNVTKY